MFLSKNYPKFKSSNPLPNGDYLSIAIWPGKKDPSAEVITIQIRRQEGGEWMTVGRLAVYRTSDGRYSKLPERRIEAKESEPEPSFEEDTMDLEEDSPEDNILF